MAKTKKAKSTKTKASAKPRAKKAAKAARAAAPVNGRVTTFTPRGGGASSMEIPNSEGVEVPVAEAVAKALEVLGEAKVDETLAPSQLRQLAASIEEVERAKAVYAKKAEDAKTAKKSLEAAVECVLIQVKEFTHPTPLPLFDESQAENDRRDMLDAAADQESVVDDDPLPSSVDGDEPHEGVEAAL